MKTTISEKAVLIIVHVIERPFVRVRSWHHKVVQEQHQVWLEEDHCLVPTYIVLVRWNTIKRSCRAATWCLLRQRRGPLEEGPDYEARVRSSAWAQISATDDLGLVILHSAALYTARSLYVTYQIYTFNCHYSQFNLYIITGWQYTTLVDLCISNIFGNAISDLIWA